MLGGNLSPYNNHSQQHVTYGCIISNTTYLLNSEHNLRLHFLQFYTNLKTKFITVKQGEFLALLYFVHM